MTTFSLEIQSPGGIERFNEVVSFTGRDSSGSFGLLAHTERSMTVLAFGLASFCAQSGSREYLALPGALLYFRDNTLLLATQSYVRSEYLERVTAALEEEIRASDAALQETRKTLRRLDEEILKRLSRLSWKGTP